MSQERIIIDDKFRPPVASVGGRSPVRSPGKASRKISKEQFSSSLTRAKGSIDDGRLLDNT